MSFACVAGAATPYSIPPDYLRQPEHIPDFWITTLEDVTTFLKERVKRGSVDVVGRSAGKREIRAVLYGKPRQAAGTTTFSGSLGFRDVTAFLGQDHQKRVYMAMAAVHGGEWEPIAGMVNLISVLETGKDLRGKPWPGISEAAGKLDRVILIPIVNVDGRARIPLRMLADRGGDFLVQEYFNTGGWPNGKLIGWPQVKEFIPLDFSKTQFPGGYPNDAGVNIQHDDFFSVGRQPETQALLDLTARERPDMILNLHTGANFIEPLRPFIEPSLIPAWEQYFPRVRTRLAEMGLQQSTDPAIAADPSKKRLNRFNLDTALNLNSGALALVVESPAHSFSTSKRDGQPFRHSLDQLMDAQLTAHEEAMKFLVETGGVSSWMKGLR
jgi:predicted deacylase